MDSSGFRTVVIFLILSGILGFVFRNELLQVINSSTGQAPSRQAAPEDKVSDEALRGVYDKLGLAPLSAKLLNDAEIAKGIKDLSISICDKTAIFKLGNGLTRLDERKTASDALLAFAKKCPNSEGELRGATALLFDMGDYASALPLAEKLVEQRPEVGDYYFLRAQVLQYLGRYREAAESYSSTIGLVDNPKLLKSTVFTELASVYAAQSRFCEAMTAIQSFVVADPVNRDTAGTRKLVSDYAAKGKCDSGYAKGEARVARGTDGVIVSKVTINGVTGNFILDTGASVVAVDGAFANKAKLALDQAGKIMVHTANGTASAVLTTAKEVRLDKVTAGDVALAVLEKPIAPGIDGLLGMSFLARFDVTLGEREVKIATREGNQAAGP